MSRSSDHFQGNGWMIGSIIFILILIVASALTLPALFSSGRTANDRRFVSNLKTLTCAETDFRANDRDWNHVNDYWTGDVKGLYTMTSAAVPGNLGGPDDPPIKLIPLALAAADADGSLIQAGGENMALGHFAVPAPREGYWFAALTRDSGPSGGPGAPYRCDTGGSPPMGSCHNLSRFGFIAFPDSPSSGSNVYLVNESCVIMRSPVTAPVRTGRSIPPGLDSISPAYGNFPDDRTLKASWSRED